MRQSKFDEAVDGAWNAGLTLSQAHRLLYRRRGYSPLRGQLTYTLPELIAAWRARKREFGCRCAVRAGRLAVGDPDQLVTAAMFGSTYGNWSGATGPGKTLREMISRERSGG